MLDFPSLPPTPTPKPPKMSLAEYAAFSETCLKSNPHITPKNCMTRRTDEATMPPFHIRTTDHQKQAHNRAPQSS